MHLQDTAVMLGHKWFEHPFATSLESCERSCLVPLHKSAIADYVGGKDCCKAASGAFFGHAMTLPKRRGTA